MKKCLNIFQIICTIIAILVTGTNSLKAQNYFIMVGKVYKNQECGSSTFSSAYAYIYEKRNGNFEYNQVKSSLLSRATNDYSVNESDVQVQASSTRYACIIEYYKEIVGWNCSTKQYAVGFGTTPDKAESDAAYQMSLYEKSGNYKVVKLIDANLY